jgi:signal transduction histidine kinase/CheY-like chemotaxis protein
VPVLLREVDAIRDRRILMRLAAAFFATHALSLLLIRFGGVIAATWPPSGIALGAILSLRREQRKWVYLGIVVLDPISSALQGFFSWASMVYLGCNLIELAIIDLLLRRMSSAPMRFERVREVLQFLLATAIGALIVAYPVGFINLPSTAVPAMPHATIIWWVGDMLAYLVLTPLVVLSLYPVDEPRRRQPHAALELLAIVVASVALAYVAFLNLPVFFGLRARPYMLAVPLMWATLRFGQRGALWSMLVMATTGVIMLLNGRPIAFLGEEPTLDYVVLEVFFCVQAVCSLVLATALRERQETARANSRMLDQLTESEERLRQSQKLEAIGQIAGGMAHDFNNVLAAVLLQLEELRLLKNLPPTAREMIGEVDVAVQRAASVTRQLLVFSRRQAMQPQPENLNTLLDSHARLLRRAVPPSTTFTVVPSVDPLVVSVDAGMIEQVLLNLVLNARDATAPSGGIRLELTEEVLGAGSVDPLPAGTYAVLRVIDNGCGIPEGDLPHIFEPFFTTKPPGRGTGLGLATAYGIVQQHGGALVARSTVGVGTSMAVWLPVVAGAVPVATTAAPSVRPPAAARPHGTILIVEDEEAVRRLLRRVLEREGYAVLDVASGRDALEQWPTIGGAVDLVITDLVMPGGVSGSELAVQLRESVPTLPIIFTSGFDPEFDPASHEMVAGDNFIPKPAKSEQILAVVHHQLDDASMARRTSA